MTVSSLSVISHPGFNIMVKTKYCLFICMEYHLISLQSLLHKCHNFCPIIVCMIGQTVRIYLSYHCLLIQLCPIIVCMLRHTVLKMSAFLMSVQSIVSYHCLYDRTYCPNLFVLSLSAHTNVSYHCL